MSPMFPQCPRPQVPWAPALSPGVVSAMRKKVFPFQRRTPPEVARLPSRLGGVSGLLAAAALAVALAPTSCSVVVDGSAQQCSTDDDCTGEGFDGTRCVEGTCRTPDVACVSNLECAGIEGGACIDGTCLANQNSCQTTAECIGASGENFICKKPVTGKRECVSLLNEDCSLVAGEYQNEDAVFIGSVLPLLVENDDTGVSTQNGAILAIEQIQGNAGGLPAASGSAGRRPLVLVSCNDSSDRTNAIRAAQYLVDVVGVQAIIGASFSGLSLGVANEVTIPAGVLLFSPSATSVALTDLADKDQRCVDACAGDTDCEAACPGLFWRTSPNDLFQSAALSAYMPTLEERARAHPDFVPGEDIRVMVLHKGDAYGIGIAQALEEQLQINGSAASAQADNYKRFDYGDPDNPGENPENYGEGLTRTKALRPHVVFVLGTDEGIQEIMAPLEDQWAELGETYRPLYMLGDGGFTASITGLIDAAGSSTAENELRVRVRGTVPGTTAAANPSFSTFANSYDFGEGSPSTFGSAGGYDITYLLAFAMASVGDGPLSGTNIARGLLRTVPPGAEIRVGTAALNTGFGIMTNPNGGNMNFSGASGLLDFDIKTGEAASDILIWCLRRNSGGDNVRQAESGVVYSAGESNLIGDEDPALCN